MGDPSDMPRHAETLRANQTPKFIWVIYLWQWHAVPWTGYQGRMVTGGHGRGNGQMDPSRLATLHNSHVLSFPVMTGRPCNSHVLFWLCRRVSCHEWWQVCQEACYLLNGCRILYIIDQVVPLKVYFLTWRLHKFWCKGFLSTSGLPGFSNHLGV